MGHSNLGSPVGVRGSPRRRSSSRRERSPPSNRILNAEKASHRGKSPKRARSRSPAFRSPGRERPSSRTKSPKHRKSSPPVSRSPVRQGPPSRNRSPRRAKSRSPAPLSPIQEKPSRTRLPERSKRRSSVSRSPEHVKLPTRTRSPPAKSRSPENHSLSPRSKRLKRAKAERDGEKGQREQERNHSRKDERVASKEMGSDEELSVERKHRRLGRDADNGSSRSRHRRSTSPSAHQRGERRSRSPSAAHSRRRDELTSSRGDEQQNGDNDSIAKMKAAEETLEQKEKQKPSFELSGKLAAETNRFRGVTLLFNEPPDARKPDTRWRLYVFKGGEVLNEPLYVHRQSCYLFGRERRVADIPTDHPSCSKQHAVLQYRLVEEENPDGTLSKRVRPYIMDLGSTNGTFINDSQIEPQRYYELFEKDTIKFGNSSREYVLLHENSAG